MIAIGEDVDNKIAYMKGSVEAPVITRVLEIDEYNETKLDETRRETYALEKRGIQQEVGGIFYAYTSASFRRSDYQQRSGIQGKRYNNELGTERGRSSKTAQRAKEILFDDEGNKISRKYSRELSFVDYANEATANEEREQLTNRMLLARPLESTATEDRKVLCIHSLQRRAKYESGIDQTKRNPHR